VLINAAEELQMPPIDMLVTYVPKEGKEAEIEALVQKHWRALAGAGLVTDEPVTIWRATDKRSGRISFVEKFLWKDEEAPRIAHQLPEVMAIWEPMTPMLDELKLNSIERLETAGT
jgi:hypothetical protein